MHAFFNKLFIFTKLGSSEPKLLQEQVDLQFIYNQLNYFSVHFGKTCNLKNKVTWCLYQVACCHVINFLLVIKPVVIWYTIFGTSTQGGQMLCFQYSIFKSFLERWVSPLPLPHSPPLFELVQTTTSIRISSIFLIYFE